MSNTLNTRISLRKDHLSAWSRTDPVLADGELAIVILEGGNENIKLGNGLSSFSQLPYLYQQQVATEKIIATEVEAKSLSQGYNVKSTPTSMATGVFAEADGNFDVVHGIEARALSTDDYAFVFNGENLPGIDQRYTSHGEGSFSVNPLSGLSGFWIGEENLSTILGRYFPAAQISGYYTKQQVNGLYVDLDGRIIALADGLSDYYTVYETSSAYEIDAALSALSAGASADVARLSGELSNYYTAAETSSAQQIRQELRKYQLSGEYVLSSEVSSIATRAASKCIMRVWRDTEQQ